MKEDLKRVEVNLDKLNSRIDCICDIVHNIDKTMAVNTAVVVEHERRSLALEASVKKLDSHFNKVLGAFIAIQVLVPVILKLIL